MAELSTREIVQMEEKPAWWSNQSIWSLTASKPGAAKGGFVTLKCRNLREVTRVRTVENNLASENKAWGPCPSLLLAANKHPVCLTLWEGLGYVTGGFNRTEGRQSDPCADQLKPLLCLYS